MTRASLVSLLALSATLTTAALPWPVQRYKTQSFVATTIQYNKTAVTSPGYLFIEPQQAGEATKAPHIMTDQGELIWRLPYSSAANNFDSQLINGTNYLTYWSGDGVAGYGAGYGSVSFLDNTYTQVYNVCQSDLNIVRIPGIAETQPCKLDLHESRITSRGTLLVTVRNITQADMRSVGGKKNGWVLDNLWLEIDIPTDTVLMRWSAVDHLDQLNFFQITTVPPAGGHDGRTLDRAWDFFHMNSVAEVPEPMGGYITSARLINAGIKLDSEGNVEWYVQGTNGGGNFSLPADAHFAFQHDIVPHDVTATTLSLSMFDDENRNSSNPTESSGLQLALDVEQKTVSVERRLLPASFVASTHTGGMQAIDDGHALVNFGSLPLITEYDANNNLIYSGMVASNQNSGNYRAYKWPWIGNPQDDPSAVMHYNNSTDQTTVYVSWNGATEVASWQVSTGLVGTALATRKTVPKNGFETKIVMRGLQLFAQVAALGSDNSTLGTSTIMTSTS